jgi:hypothetical protein
VGVGLTSELGYAICIMVERKLEAHALECSTGRERVRNCVSYVGYICTDVTSYLMVLSRENQNSAAPNGRSSPIGRAVGLGNWPSLRIDKALGGHEPSCDCCTQRSISLGLAKNKNLAVPSSIV